MLDAGASWTLKLTEDSTGVVSGTVNTQVVRGLIPPGVPPPPTHTGIVLGVRYVRHVTLDLTYPGREDGPQHERFRGQQISENIIRGGVTPPPFSSGSLELWRRPPETSFRAIDPG